MTAKLLLGPPGCGKTHALIEIVRDALDRNVPPESIGFMSFTKKAVDEAATRAGKAFNLGPSQMPYFKTLHALGFMQLGMRRGDVMGKDDWAAISDELGIETIGPATDAAGVTEYLPSGRTLGDQHLRVLERAKLRGVSLEQEFSETNNYRLDWTTIQRLERILKEYRAQLGKATFLDMLQELLESGNFPRLRLLIVDEAQDLAPLQWDIVHELAKRADEVYFAGDDDQAIHRWAGVDVKRFLTCTEDVKVLDQSYRLPKTVFDLSNEIVQRIHTRMPKEYKPTDEVGAVAYHRHEWDLPLEQGSWTLMARTNQLVKAWAETLRTDGFLFSVNGTSSLPADIRKAMKAWTALQGNRAISLAEVKALAQKLDPKRKLINSRRYKAAMQTMDPTLSYGREDMAAFFGMNLPMDRPIVDLMKLTLDEESYLRSVIRRNEDPAGKPRIDLSTIHRMKGGEDDNVALMLSSTQAAARNSDPDDEHRTFYVGATRARKALHIVEGDRRYRYAL